MWVKYNASRNGLSKQISEQTPTVHCATNLSASRLEFPLFTFISFSLTLLFIHFFCYVNFINIWNVYKKYYGNRSIILVLRKSALQLKGADKNTSLSPVFYNAQLYWSSPLHNFATDLNIKKFKNSVRYFALTTVLLFFRKLLFYAVHRLLFNYILFHYFSRISITYI